MLKSAIATKLKWGYCCKSWETFASKRGHDDGILLATMDLDVDVGKETGVPGWAVRRAIVENWGTGKPE